MHVRKFFNGRPTKYGSNFYVTDWYEFIAFLIKHPEGSASFGKAEVRMMKGGTLVANTSTQSDVSILVRKSPIEHRLKRNVTIFTTRILNLARMLLLVCIQYYYIQQLNQCCVRINDSTQ